MDFYGLKSWSKAKMLETNIFKTIVKNTPLISIDFIVTNKENKILLGKRVNKPAIGFYFTLGGRIFKDEPIKIAMKRIAKNEIGIDLDDYNPEFLGIFEHFYEDSFVGDDISTHYVNFGYKIDVEELCEVPKEQHSEYKWFTQEELLKSDRVNSFVKDYFNQKLI
jgi:colanic acid biosynthesis protein WcaH